MGARQSFQTEIERRPRSNSTAGTGIEGLSQRYRHNAETSSAEYEDMDEREDLANNLSAFGISTISTGAVAQQTSDEIAGSVEMPTAVASSPSQRRRSSNANHNHHSQQTTTRQHAQRDTHVHRHGGGHRMSLIGNGGGSGGVGNGRSGSGGITSTNTARFSLRASTRSSLLQALSGLTAGGTSSVSSSSSGSGAAASAPAFWNAYSRGRDVKCPICHKRVPSDEAEFHLVMCFTRPRIAYNDDVLDADKGECSICLEEMNAGNTIARLPCLCIYHKICIDEWFKRKNCCPEHPGEE